MSTQPGGPEIRKATLDDVDDVAEILAVAFDTDPVHNWVLRQDVRRDSANHRFFRDLARSTYIPAGEAFITTDGSGTAL